MMITSIKIKLKSSKRVNDMKYDFTNILNRRESDSIKWDVDENTLPMWIADMDFKVAPCITKALLDRVNHPIYGYSKFDEEFKNAYHRFYLDRHHFDIKNEWMFFSTGVVPTISSSVRKISKEGDNIVVLSPVYNIFYNSIVNNNRNILQVPLLYQDFKYEIDWINLEKAFSLEKTSMMILCNPANPVSKIWNRYELERIGYLAKKYNVVVLSDEIHAQLVRPNKEYIPFLSVNDINKEVGIMAVSTSKAFNMAGIQSSMVVIANESLRKKVERQLNTDECAEPNIFAQVSAIAALNDGREWLDEVRKVIFDNRDLVNDFINEKIPSLHLVNGDATYLLWIDISSLGLDSETFTARLRKETGLFLNPGKEYGGNGEKFVRMNVATSKDNVLLALKKLNQFVDLLLNEKK